MLYELLSPSIELEIDRALDCSPMSVSTANPILRRLGVAGGGSDRHFIPGCISPRVMQGLGSCKAQQRPLRFARLIIVLKSKSKSRL